MTGGRGCVVTGYGCVALAKLIVCMHEIDNVVDTRGGGEIFIYWGYWEYVLVSHVL